MTPEEQRRFDHLYELMLRNLVLQCPETRCRPDLPIASPGLEPLELFSISEIKQVELPGSIFSCGSCFSWFNLPSEGTL